MSDVLPRERGLAALDRPRRPGAEIVAPGSGRHLGIVVAYALHLFLITKGPVFWVRFEAGPMTEDFIDDAWIQATFLASSVVVLALAWTSARRAGLDPVAWWSFGLFCAVVLASTAWSVYPSRAIEQGVMLAFGTAAALVAGAALPVRSTLLALWGATTAGVGVSLWAGAREWPRSTDLNGDLAGIYFNRNSLAPIALLAAVTSLVLIPLTWRRCGAGAVRYVLVTGLALLAAVDAHVWWRTGSLTPFAGVALAAVIAFVVAVGAPNRPRWQRVLGMVTGALAATVVAAAFLLGDRVTAKRTTLSGRTTIWDVVWDFIADRPVHGWGFMSIWLDEDSTILGELWVRFVLVREAHSGYLEVLLGTGFIGLGFLLVALGVTFARAVSAAWRFSSIETAWLLGVVVYCLVVNVTETYIGANLLPWAILVTAAAHLGRHRDPHHAPDGGAGTSTPAELARGAERRGHENPIR